MPRLSKPDPLSRRVGARISALREQAGMTSEALAEAAGLSKGHFSEIENGYTRGPTTRTLAAIARALGVELLDLVTFPDADERQRIVDRLRGLPRERLAALARQLPAAR